jgi:hypothetical protein
MMMPTFTGGLIYDKKNNTIQKNDFEDWGDFDKQNSIGGWMAMAQQYFMTAWIPNQDEQQNFSASTTSGVYKLTNANQQTNIAAGSSVTLSTNQLYIGPKEYGKIEKVATGLHYTLDYGWLDILADPLSWLIHKINDVVGSWGWSITAQAHIWLNWQDLIRIVENLIINPNNITTPLKMEILNHFYAVFALPYKWHNQFISRQLIIGIDRTKIRQMCWQCIVTRC